MRGIRTFLDFKGCPVGSMKYGQVGYTLNIVRIILQDNSSRKHRFDVIYEFFLKLTL